METDCMAVKNIGRAWDLEQQGGHIWLRKIPQSRPEAGRDTARWCTAGRTGEAQSCFLLLSLAQRGGWEWGAGGERGIVWGTLELTGHFQETSG